jgi:O-acetyl-ADP-ribose deacetylase (regulator of RNase III)
MSLTFIKKDITTVTTGIIGHGCNTLGKMGSGVALAIRNKWPKAFTEYREYYVNFKRPNKEMLGISQIVDITDTLKVANCFTQESYGNDGKVYADIAAVEEALQGIFAYADYQALPIFLPRIGCGLGGLNFETDVQPILESLSEEYPNISVTICDLF